jgi:hypothetical protein
MLVAWKEERWGEMRTPDGAEDEFYGCIFFSEEIQGDSYRGLTDHYCADVVACTDGGYLCAVEEFENVLYECISNLKTNFAKI